MSFTDINTYGVEMCLSVHIYEYGGLTNFSILVKTFPYYPIFLIGYEHALGRELCGNIYFDDGLGQLAYALISSTLYDHIR